MHEEETTEHLITISIPCMSTTAYITKEFTNAVGVHLAFMREMGSKGHDMSMHSQSDTVSGQFSQTYTQRQNICTPQSQTCMLLDESNP